MPEFFNQATLMYNGQSRVSNIVTGFIALPVSAAKNANKTTYTPGEEITYTISIVNSKDTPISEVEIADNLGSYTTSSGSLVTPLEYVPDSLRYFLNGVLQSTPMISTSPTLTVMCLTIPALSNAIIQYTAKVNNSAPLGMGQSIVNNATVSGNGITTPIVASETVFANEMPILEILKSLSPTIVPEGGNLSYTFVIQNFGPTPTDATTPVSVTDNFNPIILNPVVTLNGRTLIPNVDYSYNAATGAFTTLTPITVPAASYTQDPTTGIVTVSPGTATLIVNGNLS